MKYTKIRHTNPEALARRYLRLKGIPEKTLIGDGKMLSIYIHIILHEFVLLANYLLTFLGKPL